MHRFLKPWLNPGRWNPLWRGGLRDQTAARQQERRNSCQKTYHEGTHDDHLIAKFGVCTNRRCLAMTAGYTAPVSPQASNPLGFRHFPVWEGLVGLAGWAKEYGVRMLCGAPSEIIHTGDIVVFDFSHVGIVCDDKRDRIFTIEANTGAPGGRDDDGIFRPYGGRKHSRRHPDPFHLPLRRRSGYELRARRNHCSDTSALCFHRSGHRVYSESPQPSDVTRRCVALLSVQRCFKC
jgi:hypothetical protein